MAWVSVCAVITAYKRTSPKGDERRHTEAKPLDDERGEEAEEAAVREAEERARLPEVLDVDDGVARRL